MSNIREGGCLCGAVRYTAAWPPLATATCSCTHCQKQSGSAISILAVLPRDAVTVTGTLTVYQDRADSGQAVFRKFCGACGSPVITETPQGTADGLIFIKAGTLDDTSNLAPAVHYWTDSAQDWFVFGPGNKLPTQ